MVYFNVHRVMREVLMVKQKQQIRQKTVNYELLKEILQSIKIGVDDQKYNFQQYVTAAKNEGLKQAEIWSLAKENLSSHVSLRTLYRLAHEFLTEEAFMESKQKTVSQRKLVSVASWQQNLQPIQEAVQNHIECESCAEAYEIEKVRSGAYTYEYLQTLCIWLHETLELNCRGK